jgi:hypothetical protein
LNGVSVERFLREVNRLPGAGWCLDNLSEVSCGGFSRKNVKRDDQVEWFVLNTLALGGADG